jgi:ubiquinone/menaquinone biosynthesis C-methylase UbiE
MSIDDVRFTHYLLGNIYNWVKNFREMTGCNLGTAMIDVAQGDEKIVTNALKAAQVALTDNNQNMIAQMVYGIFDIPKRS